MNEIVRKVVPVPNLPPELQNGFDPKGSVEIRGAPPAARTRSKLEIFSEIARLREAGVIRPVSSEEAVRRIRELRDE